MRSAPAPRQPPSRSRLPQLATRATVAGVAALLMSGSLRANPTHEETRTRFLAVVTREFASWDRDQSGDLSRREIDAACADPSVRGEVAAAITAVKRSTWVGKPAIPTPETIAASCEITGQRAPIMLTLFSEGMARITLGSSRSLFGSGLPRLDAISSSRSRNSFDLAPLGALVQRNPRRVAAMFAGEEDGNFRVTIGSRVIPVSPPSDSELAMMPINEDHGLWVPVLEKAIAAVRAENRAKAAAPKPENPLQAEVLLSQNMMAMLTGHTAQQVVFDFIKESAPAESTEDSNVTGIRALLNSLFTNANRLVTCFTTETTIPGIAANHFFAVVGYSHDLDKLRLWDPRGGDFEIVGGKAGIEHGFPRANGFFSVPLDTFVRQFGGLVIETDQPAPR